MHDAFFNQMKQTMYLVMDLVPGSSLKNLVEDQKVIFSESQAKPIILQLLNAIDYLQSSSVSICHRDINPNNLILNELSHLTLIDFNVAKRFRSPD